jgi:hypothetical protein
MHEMMWACKLHIYIYIYIYIYMLYVIFMNGIDDMSMYNENGKMSMIV